MKKLLTGLVFAAALVAVAALFLPTAWRVERSVLIEGELDQVHSRVERLDQWRDWTVWNRDADPGLMWEYEGPLRGEGSVMRWRGEGGTGELVIRSSARGAGITYHLSEDGGRSQAQGAIGYLQLPDGVRVTWTLTGELGWNPYLRLLGPLRQWRSGRR